MRAGGSAAAAALRCSAASLPHLRCPQRRVRAGLELLTRAGRPREAEEAVGAQPHADRADRFLHAQAVAPTHLEESVETSRSVTA